MLTALPVSSNHISVSLFFFLIPVIILNFTSFRIAFVKGLFLPEKAPFKTGRIHGFSNRNAADDAEPFGAPTKRNLRKITVLTVKQLSPQIGEITGVKRNCFLKNLRIVCRFLRMSFFCACPGISPQRCSACPIGEVVAESYPIRTVIQFSICPSIGRQREGSFINPLNNQLGTFLPFARKNFCKLF